MNFKLFVIISCEMWFIYSIDIILVTLFYILFFQLKKIAMNIINLYITKVKVQQLS